MVGWEDRVRFSESEGGFAYRPNQVVVRGAAAVARVAELLADAHLVIEEIKVDEDGHRWIHLPPGVDLFGLIADLRVAGFRAEPNYVLFAHQMSGNPLYGNPLDGNPLYGNPLYGNPLYGNPLYGNPLYGNPLYGNPLYGNPLYGNPLYGNPLYGNPLYGNPLYGNPLYGNPLSGNPVCLCGKPVCGHDCGCGNLQPGPCRDIDYKRTGRRKNSARPALDPGPGPGGNHGAVRVVVLDSGLAGEDRAQVDQLPAVLRTYAKNAGDTEIDMPDDPPDGALDPVAGHGTFIAGVVERLAPGCKLAVEKVFKIEGDVDVGEFATEVDQFVGQAGANTIVNLSFGGYLPSELLVLPAKVHRIQRSGGVVVASAGNDGVCRRMYPACLPGVVGVGALDCNGPAPFTNFGPWVRACAPGVDLVSCFFQDFREGQERFSGWAKWSGTSFAAPVVVAALAREMTATGCTAQEAVARVIDAPGLFRLPGLGTVVNLAPGG